MRLGHQARTTAPGGRPLSQAEPANQPPPGATSYYYEIVLAVIPTMTFRAWGSGGLGLDLPRNRGTKGQSHEARGRSAHAPPLPSAGGSGYQFSYVGSTGTVASDGTWGYTWDPVGSSLVGVGAPGGGTGGTLAFTSSHGDLLGQFTAAATAVSGSRAYDPWGTVTASTGTTAGMLGYQSSWTDPASGKDLMGARWYNPPAGDFTSKDTIQVNPDPDPAAGNPFAYAADNPLSFTDPTGHLIAPAGSPATNPHYMDQLTYAVTYTGLVKRTGPVQAKKAATAAVASRQALIKAGNTLKAKQQKIAAQQAAARQAAARQAAARQAAAKKAAAEKLAEQKAAGAKLLAAVRARSTRCEHLIAARTALRPGIDRCRWAAASSALLVRGLPVMLKLVMEADVVHVLEDVVLIT
jgi:large repetitive protein